MRGLKGKNKKGTRRGSPHDNRHSHHNEGDRRIWGFQEKRNSQQRNNENEGLRVPEYSNSSGSFAGEKKSIVSVQASSFDTRIVTEYMTSRYKFLNNLVNLSNNDQNQDTPDAEGYPFNAPFRTVNINTGWAAPPNLKEDFPTMLRAAISDSQQKLQHVASLANTNNNEVLSAGGAPTTQSDVIAEEGIGEPNDGVSSSSNPIDDEYPKLTTSQENQRSPPRKGRSSGRTNTS